MDTVTISMNAPETVQINQRGQVTLPQLWRERLQLNPGATLSLLPFGEGLVLLPEQDRLEEVLERIRQTLAHTGHTPDEILATLSAAREKVYGRLYGESDERNHQSE